jgi:NAD(P)-dependent dehydrogenase (short-subunit alcohol dehydrogenase family)
MSDFGSHSTAEEVTEGIDLTGQRWLVTGVSSGLGYETARVLAMRGAHIVGAARTVEKAASALSSLGVEGTPVACELSDLAHVRAAVASVTGQLDGIIANAGIMALPTLQQRDGIELQFLTNHVGHFVLVTGLMGQLTAAGRVVVLSSLAHRMAKGLELDNLSGERDYHPWRMYGRSKMANILFARGLSKRLSQGQVANSVHPGVIATNLARHVPNPEAMFDRMRPQMKTIPQGAATQCYVAVRPEISGVTATYYSDCAPAEALPPGEDDEAAEQLWQATMELVAR